MNQSKTGSEENIERDGSVGNAQDTPKRFGHISSLPACQPDAEHDVMPGKERQQELESYFFVLIEERTPKPLMVVPGCLFAVGVYIGVFGVS